MRLWQVLSGASLGTRFGHKEAVWGVAFSADGRSLVSGSQDGTVQLWTSN